MKKRITLVCCLLCAAAMAVMLPLYKHTARATVMPQASGYYVDTLASTAIAGQRADIFNVSILTDAVDAVGDTSRMVYGANAGATESYIDYTVAAGQDTVVVYAYEKIGAGDARPDGVQLPQFSVLTVNWQEDATSVEVRQGRYASPMRYTRIKLIYRLPENAAGKRLRVHLYTQPSADTLQIGRVELYNSSALPQQTQAATSAFSVSAWLTPPDVGIDDITDTVDFDNAMADMAATGITLNLPYLWGGDTLSYRHRLIEAAQRLNIRTLVYDEALNAYLQGEPYDKATAQAMVSTYANNQGFAGHFIVDEPSPSDLPALGKAATRYRELLPGKIFYVNLFPDYAIGEYEEYLNNYFSTVGGDRVSYDYYVLQGRTQAEYDRKTSHLRNLQAAATAAKSNDANLYAVIAATGHYNPSDRAYLREIRNKADAGFQAYSAMAYGAKGVTWFTYRAMANGEYGAQSGMLDASGRKTAAYDSVKELNAEIATFADVYLTYDWTGTMTVSGSLCDPEPNFANVQSLSSHRAVSKIDSNYDLLAGAFTNGNNDALMLVNYCDPYLQRLPDVTLTLDKAYLLNVYANGKKKQVRMTGNTYSLHMRNGDGVFIELLPVDTPLDTPDDPNTGDKPNTGDDPSGESGDEKKKGCGGSLGGSAAAMAATALVASTVFIGVRKRRTAEK